MSTEGQLPIDTPPIDTPPADAPSGLPSGQPAADAFDGFTLSDDQKALFKEGKLNGRFSNLDGVLEKLKEVEDRNANLIRDQKTGDATTQKTIDDAAAAQAAQTLQTTTINEMLPEFLNNGMVLTPEMEKKATDAGIDIRDLKLGAIDVRDKTNAAHQVVGGKANYDAMLAWGIDTMTDAQKAAFDKDVTGSMGEYAIKGLYGEYQTALQEDGYVPRIEGDPAHRGVQPYADRRELYKDKDYVESAAGRRDTAAQKMYRARLNVTPDEVMYGRQ